MLYNLVRYTRGRRPRVIRRGLTLEQAQAYCQDPNTRGPGWFVGYTAA